MVTTSGSFLAFSSDVDACVDCSVCVSSGVTTISAGADLISSTLVSAGAVMAEEELLASFFFGVVFTGADFLGRPRDFFSVLFAALVASTFLVSALTSLVAAFLELTDFFLVFDAFAGLAGDEAAFAGRPLFFGDFSATAVAAFLGLPGDFLVLLVVAAGDALAFFGRPGDFFAAVLLVAAFLGRPRLPVVVAFVDACLGARLAVVFATARGAGAASPFFIAFKLAFASAKSALSSAVAARCVTTASRAFSKRLLAAAVFCPLVAAVTLASFSRDLASFSFALVTFV